MRALAGWISLPLVVAACGGGGGSSPVGNTTRPSGPAPTILWSIIEDGSGMGHMAYEGLPAVAADGKTVLLPYTAEDGMRGLPNFTLIVKDRADATVGEQVVLPLSEDSAVNSRPSNAAIDEARRFLDRTHAERNWLPMAETSIATDDDDLVDTATFADVVVTLDRRGHLVVSHTGAAVVDKIMSAWLVADQPNGGCPDCGMCTNPPKLREAAIDTASRLVTLLVGYQGTDTCVEPDSVWHVVVW
jgi:hypothetical protein